MSEPAVEARGLRKAFGKVQALDGLSLSVPTGSVFGLLGPNGAGKTTIVRMLSTLLRPDGGRALVAGLEGVAGAPRRGAPRDRPRGAVRGGRSRPERAGEPEADRAAVSTRRAQARVSAGSCFAASA